MMPPELLHTSGAGLILYMFKSLQKQIGGGIDQDAIDKLHVHMSACIHRQSDQDFPRGAMRNGLINGTKCQSTEHRRGNLFHLLCIARTTASKNILFKALGMMREHQWKSFLVFIQSYL
jgi:hypothetical protein